MKELAKVRKAQVHHNDKRQRFRSRKDRIKIIYAIDFPFAIRLAPLSGGVLASNK